MGYVDPKMVGYIMVRGDLMLRHEPCVMHEYMIRQIMSQGHDGIGNVLVQMEDLMICVVQQNYIVVMA